MIEIAIASEQQIFSTVVGLGQLTASDLDLIRKAQLPQTRVQSFNDVKFERLSEMDIIFAIGDMTDPDVSQQLETLSLYVNERTLLLGVVNTDESQDLSMVDSYFIIPTLALDAISNMIIDMIGMLVYPSFIPLHYNDFHLALKRQGRACYAVAEGGVPQQVMRDAVAKARLIETLTIDNYLLFARCNLQQYTCFADVMLSFEPERYTLFTACRNPENDTDVVHVSAILSSLDKTNSEMKGYLQWYDEKITAIAPICK